MKKFSQLNVGDTIYKCNVYDYGTSKVVGRHQEHIKLELVDSKSAVVMNGIAFGQSADARYIKVVDVVCSRKCPRRERRGKNAARI